MGLEVTHKHHSEGPHKPPRHADMLSEGHQETCAGLLVSSTPKIGRCTHHILGSENSGNPVLLGVMGLDIDVALYWLMSLRSHHVWHVGTSSRRTDVSTATGRSSRALPSEEVRLVSMSFKLAELLQQPIFELSFPGAPGHAKNGNSKPKATDSRTQAIACTDALLIIRLEASNVAPRRPMRMTELCRKEHPRERVP